MIGRHRQRAGARNSRRRADPTVGPGTLETVALDERIAYDPATMVQSRSCAALRTVLRTACDLLRLVSAAVRSHARLAAENLFLREQLALYVERQVKPRRADDATRIALVGLSWLIDWRRLLTVVKPDTLIRWHRKGFQFVLAVESMPRGDRD
jgi:putative transposase